MLYFAERKVCPPRSALSVTCRGGSLWTPTFSLPKKVKKQGAIPPATHTACGCVCLSPKRCIKASYDFSAAQLVCIAPLRYRSIVRILQGKQGA